MHVKASGSTMKIFSFFFEVGKREIYKILRFCPRKKYKP